MQEDYKQIYPSLLSKNESKQDKNDTKYLELKQTTNVETKTTVSLIEKLFSLKDSKNVAMVTYNKNNEKSRVYTWKEYVEHVQNFAMYLTEETKGNVAIHSFNCPEWFIAALGSICTGIKDYVPRFFCGIYATNRDEQCMHIIKTGKCDTLVVESYSVLCEYYKNVFDQLAEMKINIIVIDSTNIPSSIDLSTLMIKHWNDLKLGVPSAYKAYPVDSVQYNPAGICTLIFTSGTTGNPKAVEITHQNIFTTMEGVLDKIKLSSSGEKIVSYLPLSHIAGQAIDMYLPIFVQGETHFAKPDAMKGSLKDTLTTVHPTLFFGVPRVWEKIKEGLEKVSEKKYSSGIKGGCLKGFMNVIKSVERNYNVSDSYCKRVSLYPFTIFSSRITNKIKEQLGLDKCKYFATGAAPISKDVLEYFASIGICILELYGMSETCGVITVSNPVKTIQGSCGSAIKNIEIKIGEHNEILVKGGNVFNKYYGYEGSSGIDEKGYLHTGDCGKIDSKGYLYITGRIKELLITAGGENIPPVLIEDNIKQIIDKQNGKNKVDVQPVLIGDRKKFLSLLLFVSADSKSDNSLTNSSVKNIIKEYNDKFAISNSQKIQKFKIINEGLSIENNLLTPTMKIKRTEVVKRFSKTIDELYAETE